VKINPVLAKPRTLRHKEKTIYLIMVGGENNLWSDSEILHKAATTKHPITLCYPPQKRPEGERGIETLFSSSYFCS